MPSMVGASDRASCRGIGSDAAPDLHCVLPFDVPPTGRGGGVVDDGGRFLEPSRGVPDADPAVSEASGAVSAASERPPTMMGMASCGAGRIKASSRSKNSPW